MQLYLILHEADHGAACRKRWPNGLAVHICGWPMLLPFLCRQRNHLQHQAWAGHPTRDPGNRGIIEKFRAMSHDGATRLEFVLAALDPADCLEFIPGKLAQTFLERAGGDTSAPNRKEIRFVRIYLAGCAAVLCAAAASGHAVALLCWYIPAVIVQLMSVELLNLPHHAEAPPLPARGRSPSLLGP